MKRLTIAAAGALIAGIIGFFATSDPMIRVPEDGDSDEGIEIVEIPSGKVLYAVVDADGVYLGSTRYDVPDAKRAVTALLKQQRIRNLIVFGTDLARYGDAIDLFLNVDPRLLRWRQLVPYPLTTGARKPLTGFLKPRCCFSEDIENTPRNDWHSH